MVLRNHEFLTNDAIRPHTGVQYLCGMFDINCYTIILRKII